MGNKILGRTHSLISYDELGDEQQDLVENSKVALFGGYVAGGVYQLDNFDNVKLWLPEPLEYIDIHTLIVPPKKKQFGKHVQPFYHKGKW